MEQYFPSMADPIPECCLSFGSGPGWRGANQGSDLRGLGPTLFFGTCVRGAQINKGGPTRYRSLSPEPVHYLRALSDDWDSASEGETSPPARMASLDFKDPYRHVPCYPTLHKFLAIPSPKRLQKHWNPEYEVELFASLLNARLATYAAARIFPGALSKDAMTFDWNRWKQIYLFPPVPMLPGVTTKLQSPKRRGLLSLLPGYWRTDRPTPWKQPDQVIQSKWIPDTRI